MKYYIYILLIAIFLPFIICDEYYTIKSGDSLSKIASIFGTTVSQLCSWNNIKNANLIYAGQRIIVKKTSNSNSSIGQNDNNENVYYTIKSGDTLSKIASKYGTTVSQLCSWNNIQNANKIYIGQKIIVKKNITTEPSTPEPEPYIPPKTYPSYGYLHQMMQKLQNSRQFGEEKKKTMVVIGNLLLEYYEPAFVAGILGNIFHEANIGKFESSNYSKDKPQYLEYMDSLYDYRKKYSGRYITDVSLNDVYQLLKTLKNDNWKRGKFGLGCVQWTADRTFSLVETYRSECGNCNRISLEQAISAEGKMILNELNSYSYNSIYNSWKKKYSGINSPDTAYSAGCLICLEYEKPKEKESKAPERGNTARDIYNIMTN